MAASASGGAMRQESIRKVALASFIGTAIEWYDYFLFGTAAALVFPRVFFPEQDPLAGTLASFAVFAVGFFFRPVGGVIFGHFGDRVGRKAMLVLSLLIMGIGTILIGLLPTYGQIGIWATVLLVALRCVQGLGVGGEWGGAILMATEHSPPGRRGFYGSWPQIGVPAGLLLGTAVLYLFRLLPDEQFFAWGWRIPFLLSIVMVGVGLYIRLKILESPAFRQVQSSGTRARMPIVDVLRTYPRSVLIAMGLRVAENGSFYVFTVFVLDYVSRELGLPSSTALLGVMIAAALELAMVPFFGSLTDRVGRKPVYMFGALAVMATAFPFFWLVNTEITPLIWLAVVIALVGHAAMYGTQGAFFSELFGTRVRYSGASLGYQLASVFAGALSPIIALSLLGAFNSYVPVALYLMFMALITVVAVYFSTESYRDDIEATHSAERKLIREAGGSVDGPTAEPEPRVR